MNDPNRRSPSLSPSKYDIQPKGGKNRSVDKASRSKASNYDPVKHKK